VVLLKWTRVAFRRAYNAEKWVSLVIGVVILAPRGHEKMTKIAEVKRFIAVMLFVAAAGAGVLVGSAPAHADPPPCGSPDVPCAPPLTPDQQCALIAWRTWLPCNWVGVQVPSGTPGSVG
jgi:hypothetical protein